MKHVNKLASLILATLMLCLSVFGVSAAELIDETLDMIIIEGEGEQEEFLPMRAVSCTVPIAGYGSTGRTEPQNLHEQMVMEACMSDPFGGDDVTCIINSLSDERWDG